MNGLDLANTPFRYEVASVFETGKTSPCYHYDLELHINGNSYKPITILGVDIRRDFLNDFYQVLAVEFQTTGLIRETLIENMDQIEATFKRYELPRSAGFSYAALKNPVIRRYKAKLYLEESDFITQDNFAVNNAEYMANKLVVSVKVQLAERGLENIKTRSVGGTYHNLTGGGLLRHLIDYHANRDNDDVATLINGVDCVKGENPEVWPQIPIRDGTKLLEAMHVVNENTGGIYPDGFSYFIHNNTWYIYPPYALNRFSEPVKKLVIVNLPKNRLPGVEKTYTNQGDVLIVLSTRDSIVKDKREAQKINLGTGVRFVDVRKILGGFGEVEDNKIMSNISNNVSDLRVDNRADGVNHLRFSKNKLTAAKNIELSRLAQTKGFMMRLSWEGSDESLIVPGMPVKVMYLKRNKTHTAEGTVIGVTSSFYPFETSYPAMKFGVNSYIDVFVGDVDDAG